MFKTRLLSGIVLVAIIVAFGILGGYYLFGFTLAISLIGMYELYRVFKIERTALGLFGYLAAICYDLNLLWHFIPGRDAAVMIFAGLFILLMAVFVFGYPKFDVTQVMASFFGMFYVAVMLSFVYRLRTEIPNGLYLVFLIYLCAWGSDTFAYVSGKTFGKGGKHKMTPKLSPNKTIEGGIGGVLGAGIITAIYCTIFASAMNLDATKIVILALIAAAGGLVSMIGDLCASAIKRFYDIKDYGKLIPGHGGIMDRFDSIIITAPIIYYLAFLFV
ncbi:MULTISPECIES: phosphatidate cytidylyltransferase [Agathobacter]|uniref:Phosphatidate cytidylyltransferase n=1 Tax=Agathobacter ruminis TaxID=1712665 RepID=A0A2G3E4R9_9FIRM|nr:MULTISPECIES: phosphatidate cytidylyltransferase [Agathobacter]MBQ1682268.1 phosphatidate cytidylyltransferase [Agathobacter sp.]MDC7302602.1 phosphatidate cytidylyltransferase [Agathobacter ruminis]PHU38268.1 phosphatidate cytidylyltransferase [Agathobacter ruminis]